MHRIRIALLAAALACTAAADSLSSARAAQARLGKARWSRVIQIENENPASRYPARLHALVFEMGGLLWFYTETDGTQSFSLHRGRLAEEMADFGPLLRDIEPGFGRHRILEDGGAEARRAARRRVPHGCFVECIGFHDWLAESGRLEKPAQLLTYYMNARAGRRGHTVLLYEEGSRLWVYDPDEEHPVFQMPNTADADPMTMARALLADTTGHRLVNALYTRVPAAGPGWSRRDTPAAQVASVPAPQDPGEAVGPLY